MDYRNINDYEQLYLVAEKDDEANKLFYEKYKPIIYSLAYNNLKKIKNLGVDIEELVQEGYIGLSKAIDSYKDNLNANFYTFATVCIDRQIKSYCRKFRTKKNITLSNKISIDDDTLKKIELPESIYSDNNPEFYLNNSNYNDLCIKFKHILTLRASLVFELKSNGFSRKEICKLLEISPSMFERAICEIRKKGINYLNN